MTDCIENKRKLEHLQESKVSALQLDATVKDLKESFETHKRQSQADSDKQARRIQFVEMELKKSKVPPSTDLQSLRAKIIADVQIMLYSFTEDVQNLLSDVTKELMGLTTSVENPVVSMASVFLSDLKKASITPSMKKRVQDKPTKIAVESVRSLVNEDVPLAI